MVSEQLHGMHSGGSSLFSKKIVSQTRMSNSTTVTNRLIPAGVQMMSAWLVNDGCNFEYLSPEYLCEWQMGTSQPQTSPGSRTRK